ncbi:MAG: radical SAM protein [Halanaerobiales bacterium]|nr:radical SAM protein [Halanaerobiales bacterium]
MSLINNIKDEFFYENNRINLASWISFRNYQNKEKYRTIISNEKNHNYIFLEGVSSKLFSMLSEGLILSDIINFLKEENIVDQLNDFLIKLKSSDIIISKSDIEKETKPFYPPMTKEKNAENNNEEELKEWVKENGFLWSVHWNLTYKCNENCKHCYIPDVKNVDEKAELSKQEIFKAIDDMADLGVFHLTLSGGEPTLRKDFFKIVNYASKKGMCITFYTNGLKLNNEFIEQLSKYWIHKVGISIYSSDPKLHDEITQVKGSFDKSVNALKKLYNKGIKTEINSVQLNNTVQGYFKTKKLTESLGGSVTMDFSLSPKLNGDLSPLSFEIDFDKLIVLSATSNTPLSVDTKKDEWGYRYDEPVCGAGHDLLCIGPQGGVYPCASFPFSVGNIKTTSLKSIWQDSLYGKNKNDSVLAQWQRVKLENFIECGKYDYCSYCDQICPAEAFLEKGNYLEKVSYNCKQAKARMEADKLLKNGLNRKNICYKLNISKNFGWQNG